MDRQKRSKLYLFSVIGLFFFFTNCSEKDGIYHEYISIKNSDFYKNEACNFEFQIEDLSKTYDINLEIRNNNRYLYKNVWLFVAFRDTIKTIFTDTVNCPLANEKGEWYGKGLSIYNHRLFYKKGLRFSHKGKYFCAIRQAMRENPLAGISDIGIKVTDSKIDE